MSCLLRASWTDLARFMGYVVVQEDGCWLWLGGRSGGRGNKLRYGSFWVRGHGSVRAHRFSAEVLGRQVCPEGHHRDHLCNNSLCVNPSHLEVVTHAENERRRQERRKIALAE